MNSLPTSSKDRATLIVYINSGSVGVGLRAPRSNNESEMVYADRRNFFSGEEAMISALRNSLNGALISGVPQLTRRGLPLGVGRSLVVLGAPWSVSHHLVHDLDSDQTFNFGQDQRAIILKEHQREHESRYGGADHGLFENDFISLSINGYQLKDTVEHEKVRRVGGGIISSSANKKLLTRVENEIAKIFGTENMIHIRSFPYVSSKFGQRDRKSPTRRMIVSFNGNHTEVAVFEGGNIEAHHVFNFGPHMIIGEISSKLDLPHKVAHSYLKLFLYGVLDKLKAMEIKDLISKLEDNWREEWKSRGLVAEEVFIISSKEEEEFAHSLISSLMPKARILVGRGVSVDVSARRNDARGDHWLDILSSVSHKIFD